LALTVLAIALGAAIAAPPALGLSSTVFSESSRPATEGAGKLDAPQEIAVDQSSGDLYIADTGNRRIDKFDAAGNFLMAWGFGVADGVTPELQTCGPEATPPTSRCFWSDTNLNTEPGSFAPTGVAVDQASGDVYVTDEFKHRVTKFSSSGEFLLMFGKNVNTTPGTLTPNLCTAADLAKPGTVCGNAEIGSEPGEFFTLPIGITVDSTGHVWVGDFGRLVQFDSAGHYVSQAPVATGERITDVARDSTGDFYVQAYDEFGVRSVGKYTSSGSPVDTLSLSHTLDAAGHPHSVALDSADNVYIGDHLPGSSGVFMKFNPAGEQVAQFGSGQIAGLLEGPYGIAVGDSSEALYALSSGSISSSGDIVESFYAQRFSIPDPGPLSGNEHATGISPTGATLEATVNAEGDETTYRFEYGPSASYGQSTPVQTLPGVGFADQAVAAGLEGLIPDTAYHFRVVATNHCNDAVPADECTVAGPDVTFTTLPAVGIAGESATDVTATSAILHADLDPRGVAAQWWIEIGTSESYGQSTTEGSLAGSSGPIAVSTSFHDLAPGTTYHYRFAARDERDGIVYIVHGADRTFTTQLNSLDFGLADGRAWEMVSPPKKFGAVIKPPESAQGGHLQAAADGNGLAYLSFGSLEPFPAGSRAPEEASAIARRDGSGSWSSKDLTPPHTTANYLPAGAGLEYKLFSTNLERGILDPRDATPLSAAASERTPYLRINTQPESYTPLVTGKAGFANVPPGTEFGGDPDFYSSEVKITGANPALSHVVLRSDVPLAPGAAVRALYEWASGELRPVSVLPVGEGGATVEGALGSTPSSLRKAISDDGSRVFWTASSGGLYVRDLARSETARLDTIQPGAFGSGTSKPVFQGANAEGTAAFFTDTRQLTEDANEGGADLYRCELRVEGGNLGCTLTDLTAAPVGAKEEAQVLGLVPGMSDDGSRAYFVARGVLDSGVNGEGGGAVKGQPNLYLWQAGSGIRFIATLSEEDGTDWGARQGVPVPRSSFMSADASPSGRYLAFMSRLSLTGYDNRDANSGDLSQEVFRYDAGADELVCASCNPSGARPAANRWKGSYPYPDWDVFGLWAGQAVAAVLPEATQVDIANGGSIYRPRAVHDNGRLFFNAGDSLVPADSNGNWDVYQYEPTGTGDCAPSSGGSSISRSAGGCVSLISSGTGDEESTFLDASVGGDDVFFFTKAQLSVTDEDEETDVYDARVGGIPATLAPHVECLGESCQPPARAPDDPTPATASSGGSGNVAPRCPKGKRKVTRKGKSRCVPRQRKHNRHGKRQSGHNRGARR